MTEQRAARTRTTPRVLVVDDDALVRAGLRRILERSGVLVVGEREDGAGIVEACADLRPDVVLMDVRMPGVDGLTATRTLRARPDAPAVLVLTTFHADAHVLESLRCGASGYLLKDATPEEFVRAVHAVVDGDVALSPRHTRVLARQAVATPAADPTAQALLAGLSHRELEVARGVATGASNAEIAAALGIAESTVKAHLGRVFAHLGTTNRVQVALLVRDALPPATGT